MTAARKRRGRKRNAMAERTPAGAIVRERQEDPRRVVAMQRMQHHGLPASDASSPLAGSVVGRMQLARVLTANEVIALEGYERVRAQWCMVMGMPPHSPRACSMDPDDRGGADGRDVDEDEARAIKLRWRDLQCALSQAHPLALAAVADAVDRDVSPEWMAFRCGVQALRQHFELADDRPKG